MSNGKRLSVKVNEVPPQGRSNGGKRRSIRAMQNTARARDALYRVAEGYIRAAGGSVAVIGGVEVQRWSGEPRLKYRLAIRITGEPPHYAPEAPQDTEDRRTRSKLAKERSNGRPKPRR